MLDHNNDTHSAGESQLAVSSPPICAPAPPALEIELLSDGRTTLRTCQDHAVWPVPWDDNYYRDGLGLACVFSLGYEYDFRLEVWAPGPDGRTEGFTLVAISSEGLWQHLWASTLAIAFQFVHNAAPMLQAGALCAIAELYRDQREDADAQSRGYKHRGERERAFERALRARVTQ